MIDCNIITLTYFVELFLKKLFLKKFKKYSFFKKKIISIKNIAWVSINVCKEFLNVSECIKRRT